MAERKKKEKSRRKIMHAAKGLFEREGIENVSFGDIAEAAEVCRTTVFNHFAGTDALLAAIFEEEIADIEDYCREQGKKGTALIEALFDKLIEDTASYPVLTYRVSASSILQEAEANTLGRIEDMINCNLSQPDRLKTLAIMGAYYGLVNHYHAHKKHFDAEVMKEEFHQMLAMLLEKEYGMQS